MPKVCLAEPVAGGGTILVVDDEPLILDVAERILERSEFSVITARDGIECCEILRERGTEISAVLLDMTMPRMDGKKAFAEIRALCPETPVVFISGYSVAEGAEALGDARTAFVHKPFRLPALAARIREVMTPGSGAAYS
jgi:CheY-like chemotaxis protein